MNTHSDFYCFLYNRSRIKPLSKYCPAKSENSLVKTSSKYLTDIFKRNKVVSSSEDIDNKRYLYSKAKEQEMTEEEKIMNWLVSYDDDSNDKLNTKSTLNEITKNDTKEINDCKNNDLHDNRLIDDTVETVNKKWTNIVSNESDNNVNSLNLKKSISQSSSEDQDISKTIKSGLLGSTESNDSESIKISKDHSSKLYKKKLSRKDDQRKISDFFQKI